MEQEKQTTESGVLSNQDLTKKSYSVNGVYYKFCHSIYFFHRFFKQDIKHKILLILGSISLTFGNIFFGLMFESTIFILFGLIMYILIMGFFLFTPEDYIFKKDIKLLIRWFK